MDNTGVVARWKVQLWFMAFVVRLLMVISAKLTLLGDEAWIQEVDESLSKSGMEFIDSVDKVLEKPNENQSSQDPT